VNQRRAAEIQGWRGGGLPLLAPVAVDLLVELGAGARVRKLEAGARRGCRIAPRLAPEVSDPPASADPAADDLALRWSLLDRPGHDRGSNNMGEEMQGRGGALGRRGRASAALRVLEAKGRYGGERASWP
jgi:hypothetical protein